MFASNKYPWKRLHRRVHPRTLPAIEQLEDRTVPSGAGGLLDLDFGDEGLAAVGLATSTFTDVAVQEGGKIVVLGNSTNGEVLARFNPDGTLDDGGPQDSTPSDQFGSGGMVTNGLPGVSRALAIQNDERIVTVGRLFVPNSADPYRVTRYNSDGTLDDGSAEDSTPGDQFGPSGSVSGHFRRSFDNSIANDVVIDSSGKILLAGVAQIVGSTFPGVARLNADGTVDDGSETDSTPGDSFTLSFIPGISAGGRLESLEAVALQNDGKIVLAVTLESGTERGLDFGAVRLNSDGSLDDGTSADSTPGDQFGVPEDNLGFSGVVITDVGGFTNNRVSDLKIDSQGKIVITGFPGVIRYNPDGSLDDGSPADSTPGDQFGAEGSVIVDIVENRSLIDSTALIQDDGKIVLTGTVILGPTTNDRVFGLARLNSNGSFDDGGLQDTTADDSFGTSGRVVTDFGRPNHLTGAVLDNQGGILVSGTTSPDGSPTLSVARYLIESVPNVESVRVASDLTGFVVQLNDDDLVAVTAENPANYRVFAANGDADEDGDPFNDGDETEVLINLPIQYDSTTDQIRIHTDPLLDDFFRLEIQGQNFTNANGDSLNGGEYTAEFNLKIPVILSTDIGVDLQSIFIQLDDNDLNQSLAENLANYRIIAANGDANGDGDPFNDGDETSISISSITYDPVADHINVQTANALFADFFRLELDGDDEASDGTPGITNLDGAFVSGEDIAFIYDLNVLTFIGALLDKVESLGLSTSTENSLTSRLSAAAQVLGADVDKDDGLIHILEAFRGGVAIWFDRGEISLADLHELRADVDLILLGLALTNDDN